MVDVKTETLLTPSAAGRKLAKSARTVKLWIRQGVLEGVMVQGRLHTSLEALARFVTPVQPIQPPATPAEVEKAREAVRRRRLRAKGLLK